MLGVAIVLSLLAQLTKFRTVLRRTSIAVGVISFLFASSAVWDWQQFERTTRGVVTSAEAIARKGNSENYAAAFSDSLAEGAEFVVLETRDNWLHVQVGDVGTGWLRAEDVVTF